MEYSPEKIEKKYKKYWKQNSIYKVVEDPDRPKYYVLDMFPYPSGSGLHVGHPLGYIASDVLSRYKRMRGYNVLHPMGFDAFGLPAEQYAIQTGQHPKKTTTENIKVYKSQLENLGFMYDWDREVLTSDPKYYKWTQWIFLKLYESWYNRHTQKTEPITTLITLLNTEGNEKHPTPNSEIKISASQWLDLNESEKEVFLMNYRLAYLSYAEVNWCEELGTVLANDEVINGRSERGGHPVERRKMRQWFLRITEYADRLLSDLDNLDWSPSLKEIQKNWIGKSQGAELHFDIDGHSESITVFTTRPDTIYGTSFMVLAPEHELVPFITQSENKKEVQDYIQKTTSRSERERMADAENVTGVNTGAFAIHPFTQEKIPIYLADYVLASYGTGAIMAVPAGDERDHKFAKRFGLPIPNIFGDNYTGEEAYTGQDATLQNSHELDGMKVAEAKKVMIQKIESQHIGRAKINYKLRDAGFSRQRYWGEPFPIKYRVKGDVDAQFLMGQLGDTTDIPVPLDAKTLPLELPEVESYESRGDGRSPLANNSDWVAQNLETDTMPGYAGSSWYFMRYTDPHNSEFFAGADALKYWSNVDVYFGGAEHAVGHLLYSRMWTKAMYDLDLLPYDEPFKKLVNQGMIQGQSKIVHRKPGTDTFVSYGLTEGMVTDPIHVDVQLVKDNVLDQEGFRKWRPEYAEAKFELEEGKFYCEIVVEKMSKRYHNVVNPDDVVAKYGADTFRMYEMFLGPIEMSKPWDTQGIEGVSRFIKKLWRLCYDDSGAVQLSEDPMTPEEKKIIHQTIKKTQEDIESYSFNTAISQFMIAVNQLQKSETTKREAIENLILCIAPFAPFIAEEIYQTVLGHGESICLASFPDYDESALVESTKTYPVAFNGKARLERDFAVDASKEEIENKILADEEVKKYLEGKEIKKFIFVPGRMINLVY